MKKVITCILTAALAITCLCACGDNANNTSSTPAATRGFVDATGIDSSETSHATISNIEQLDLSKINKVAAYVNEYKVESDKASELCNIIKTIQVTNETEAPKGSDGATLTSTTELYAYSDNVQIYRFCLLGTAGSYKMYVNDGKTYFYSDISDANAEAFTKLYDSIYEKYTGKSNSNS